jgi:hypothetical protein
MRNSKQFIIGRILGQAEIEAVSLTNIEIRMLSFTEASSASKDIEAAKIFERDYDDEEYEAKIAGLIRRAYARDKEAGKQEAWDIALVQVSGRDLYLNVMIDRSGIVKDPTSILRDWRFFLYAVSPSALSIAIAVFVGFSPLGARLIHNDGWRLLLTIAICSTPYFLLQSSKHRHKKIRKVSVR